MYSIHERIRQLLRAPCPLCGLTARGGDLCTACEGVVRFAFDARVHCARCLYREAFERVAVTTFAQHLCAACTHVTHTYARAMTGLNFASPGDQLMRDFKSNGRLTDAGLFARLLWRNMQKATPELPALTALVAIPSGRDALLQRGFNPAGEIARALAGLTGVPLRSAWLSRTRETSSQKRLNRSARQQSVQGLFAARVPSPCGWVGVVDDVLTTGSTLEQASEALLRAGAQGVVALIAARTLAK